MKNINFNFFAVLSFLLVFYSCEYSPSEIPLTEVKEPTSPPSISVNLTPKMDTLKLFAAVSITYVVDVGTHEIYNLKFLMDGKEISNVYSNAKGSYYTTIPTYSFDDGLHELKIKTYTSTNSGSIADRVGAEQFLYELSWPVYINKEARDQMKFTNLQVLPDGIKLSWFKYDYADFQRYVVSRSSLIPGYSQELVSTTNPYLTSFIDKTYIEGDYVTYSLMAYVDGLATDSRSYVEEIKKPKVMINSDLSVGVNWSSSKHSQNVGSYFLKTNVPQFGYTEEKEISDLNQTNVTFNEKLGFGGSYGMQLRYIPKGYNGYNTFEVKGGLTEFALGDSIPAFERGFLIHGTNSLLLYKDGNFFKYNYSTGQKYSLFAITPIESVYQRFIVSSSNGELFGYLENKQLVVRKSRDWSLVKKMDIEAYADFNSILSSISISNNGLVATVDIYNSLRIFNLLTGTKILEKESEGSQIIQGAVLSPDGESVCLRYSNSLENRNSLVSYAIEHGTLNEKGRYENVGYDCGSNFSFSPVNGKVVYFNYMGMYSCKIEILNPETLAVEYTSSMPEWFIPITYDYSNDRVVGQYQFFPIKRFSYLLDVKTGTQSKVVQFVGKGQYLFSDGTVFSGNGRLIKIDDYIIK